MAEVERLIPKLHVRELRQLIVQGYLHTSGGSTCMQLDDGGVLLQAEINDLNRSGPSIQVNCMLRDSSSNRANGTYGDALWAALLRCSTSHSSRSAPTTPCTTRSVNALLSKLSSKPLVLAVDLYKRNAAPATAEVVACYC